MESARNAAACLPAVVAATLTLAACSDNGPADLSLADVPPPDTNTAVVLLDGDVFDGGHRVAGGSAHVYSVDTGRIPHTFSASSAFDGDTATLTIVVSDLYTAGIVQTDGTVNRLAWTGPGGTVFTPVSACSLEVLEPFRLGMPSVQHIQTACRVAAVSGDAVTLFVKTHRFLPVGGS